MRSENTNAPNELAPDKIIRYMESIDKLPLLEKEYTLSVKNKSYETDSVVTYRNAKAENENERVQGKLNGVAFQKREIVYGQDLIGFEECRKVATQDNAPAFAFGGEKLSEGNNDNAGDC